MVAILDYSQVAIAAVMADAHSGEGQLDEALVRHMILNSIRMHKSRTAAGHREFVVACDGANSWRKQKFPQYKANRKKNREDDPIDWDMLHRVMRSVREDLEAHFPYRVVHVENAEADDVIGVVARHAAANDISCLIISGDKDFKQLHVTKPGDDLLGGMGETKLVSQYSPSSKDWVVCDDVVEDLGVHVLKGDSGDGIPNILSPDDVFVTEGTRQPVVSAKMKADWLRHWSGDSVDDSFWAEYEAGKVWASTKKKGVDVHDLIAGYRRNLELIDLRWTPPVVREEVVRALAEPVTGDFDSVMKYMAAKEMRLLLDHVEDFV